MVNNYVDQLFSYIEKTRSKYDEMLKNEQKPKTGSGEGTQRALDWASEMLRNSGAAVEPCEAGAGSPSVLRAVLGKARDKKTVLIYSHLRPQCNAKENALFGAGIKGSKGPLVSFFAAIDVYKQLKIQLPVNIRFLFEAMTEKDANLFRKYLHSNSKSIFAGVDHVCILDNRTNPYYGPRPILCWALRGCCKFQVTVNCASHTLNSGEHSGAIEEAMTDIVTLLSNVVNTKGDILIPGIKTDVLQLNPQEEKDFHKATFDVSRYKCLTGASSLLHKEDKKRLLLHMTRFPSLSIHSIESTPDSNDDSIPPSVTAKFSVHTVPNQTVNSIQEVVVDYLERMMYNINSSNKITVKLTESTPPWETNPKDPNIQACIKALKATYNDEVELVREGGTIPILNEIQENFGSSILLLPIGRAKNNSPNQVDLNIFLDSTKTISAYFYEISNT